MASPAMSHVSQPRAVAVHVASEAEGKKGKGHKQQGGRKNANAIGTGQGRVLPDPEHRRHRNEYFAGGDWALCRLVRMCVCAWVHAQPDSPEFFTSVVSDKDTSVAVDACPAGQAAGGLQHAYR